MSVKIHKGFLKYGDPALTYPWGLERTPLSSMSSLGGQPRGPESEDAVSARERAWREWETRLARERKLD